MGQPPQRGDPQIPVDGATNQLVAKFSRLYAQAAPEDQLALRVWMRDIILGRKVGSASAVRARRMEKRMVEACERRILEFPLGMDAREVAKELKREGWYAWASDYESIVFRIKRVRAKGGKLRSAYGLVPSSRSSPHTRRLSRAIQKTSEVESMPECLVFTHALCSHMPCVHTQSWMPLIIS
jgi:hypothetical protein